MKRYLQNIILFIRVFWSNLFSFNFFLLTVFYIPCEVGIYLLIILNSFSF